MKITKSQLKEIIKEALDEQNNMLEYLNKFYFLQK